MVVVWPGHIAPGARSGAFVSWVDILPTLIDLAGGEVPADIDGRSFALVLLGKTDTHRDKFFTPHTGDDSMNIFPIRSVRIGNYKYIHNLRPDAWHTNHSDLQRKDGAGAYWDSWDESAKSDEKAAAIVRAYHTRPEFELFDLDKDPYELKNLASNPEYTEKMQELKNELATWTTAQGDDLLPHQDPYLTSEPLPVIENKPKGKMK